MTTENEMICFSAFILRAAYLLKNSHNSVENDCIGKQKFTLVLKSTYKMFYSKIPAQSKDSLCWGGGNVIFSGGKEEKKKSVYPQDKRVPLI